MSDPVSREMMLQIGKEYEQIAENARRRLLRSRDRRPMTRLILKRAPIGSNLEDYSVLENGVVVGAHLPNAGRAAGTPVDGGERPQRRHTPRGSRLRADARGRDGRDGQHAATVAFPRPTVAVRLAMFGAVTQRQPDASNMGE
jgi:hypothetical protein